MQFDENQIEIKHDFCKVCMRLIHWESQKQKKIINIFINKYIYKFIKVVDFKTIKIYKGKCI